MGKNVLITGGAGFIGSHLAIRLLKKGYSVRVLDNLSSQVHGEEIEKSFLYQSIKDKVEFIKGDVRNIDDWQKALVNQHIIIHLAAETGTGQSMYEISKYVGTNISGTSAMLDVLSNTSHNVQKVIVASSRAIYGEGKYFCSIHKEVFPLQRLEENMSKGDFNSKCPKCNGIVSLMATDELSMIHPTSIYGITKQNQEQIVLLTCRNLGIPAVSFRYQNVYGPGQSLLNPYTGILSIFSTQILNKNSINIFEDGKESRDFVYIEDVVSATVLGIEKDEANGCVYNVGSGISTSVEKVAKDLMQKYKEEVEIIVSGNYRIGDIRHNYADLTNISKLGFKPTVTFEEGISNFVEWVSSQNIVVDRYFNSLQEMKDKGLYK